MLTENARVVAIDTEGVRVETLRQSACSSCRSQAGCGQKLLAEAGQGQPFEILAGNPLKLVVRVGDAVELGLEEASFLQASLMVYLLPLLGLVLSALIVDSLGAAEPLVIAAAVLGLCLGFFAVRWWGARDRQQCRYQPQILRLTSL
jgi:sigma-E factor negative regulatory protein RseC